MHTCRRNSARLRLPGGVLLFQFLLLLLAQGLALAAL
jgi:hypothetical protein